MKWVIFTSITGIFLLAGVFIPYINAEYGYEDADTYSEDITDIQQDMQDKNVVTFLLSIASMFVWTFGALPLWLDAVLWVFRFVWWSIVVDSIIP